MSKQVSEESSEAVLRAIKIIRKASSSGLGKVYLSLIKQAILGLYPYSVRVKTWESTQSRFKLVSSEYKQVNILLRCDLKKAL